MSAAALPSARVRSRGRLSALWGPGLIVMLADTDAGCLITAAQSGAQWGYAMVLPQIALIPILFMVQEITVRLGVVTGKGHGTLIREHFGTGWAWFSGATLFISAIGALLTEFVGVAGVGELFGIPRTVTIPVATAALVGVCFTRGYARVERIGIVVGLGELAFIPAMLLAHPRWSDLSHGLRQFPVHHASYLFLLAANIGAVVMPWMIFYQQSAIVDKGLRRNQLADERRDTAVGSVLTQVIMIVVVVAFAATVFTTRRGAPLNSVADLAHGLAPATGTGVADVLVGVAVLGGALVAALVVSLAGSWGLAEVLRWRHSLNESLQPGQLEVLRRLHPRPRGRGCAGARQRRPRQSCGGRRGDERAAAARHADLPAAARGEGAARRTPHARPLSLGVHWAFRRRDRFRAVHDPPGTGLVSRRTRGSSPSTGPLRWR